MRDLDLRRGDQRQEVKDKKVKSSHCQKRRGKTSCREKGKAKEWIRNTPIKTSAALFSIFCGPDCGLWIRMMAGLALARSGTLLMMFCNWVL